MKGKIALVAGGSGGIGRQVVSGLISAGATVVVAGRSPRLSDEACEALGEHAQSVIYRPLDLLDASACRRLAEDVSREFGSLHHVLNCASVSVANRKGGGKFMSLDPAVFTPLLEASLTSLFNLCHACLPFIAASGGGSLVTFASDSGRVAAPNQTMVGSTRAAIMMFSRSLALEVAKQGIRVNCVSMSFVRDTPIFDQVMAGDLASRAKTAVDRAGLGLPGPGNIADLALFLCSDASAYLTGQVISVNGGVSAGT